MYVHMCPFQLQLYMPDSGPSIAFFLAFILQTYWLVVYQQIAYFYYSNDNNYFWSEENNMDAKKFNFKSVSGVCMTGNETIWQNIRN